MVEPVNESVDGTGGPRRPAERSGQFPLEFVSLDVHADGLALGLAEERNLAELRLQLEREPADAETEGGPG